MSKMYFLPFRPAFDSAGAILPGSQHYFTLEGTNTPSAPFTDAALTIPHENPVIANGVGYLPAIYLNEAISYRVRIYAPNAEVGVDDPVEEYDPYVPALAGADILSDLAAVGGAELIGLASGSTVQEEIERLGTKNEGVLPAGTFAPATFTKTGTGAITDDSDWRARIEVANFNGAYGATQVNGHNLQVNLNHSAGTVVTSYVWQAYGALGVPSTPTTTGNVTSFNGIQIHLSHTGSGSVGDMTLIDAAGPDLNVGVGSVTNYTGMRSGDFGNDRITGKAFGFKQANCSVAATGPDILAAFGSDMSGGANRRGLYFEGGAVNNLAGQLAVGKLTAPTDFLEISGFAKLNRNGTPLVAGTRHEITSDNNDYVLDIFSADASAPRGVHLKFSAAAPNNTTQDFLTCEDNSAIRMRVWSNGNLVNANNSYGAISDKKLKKNIRNAGPQLDDIRAVKVRKYRLKSDGKHAKDMLGVIAQELEKTSPGLVNETPDYKTIRVPVMHRGGVAEADVPLIGQYTEETKALGTFTKSVNYSVLYMKAVKALQELADIVEKQGKEIAVLKAAK